MPLIVSPARLEMLADGKRRRIVYSDGTKSYPFATRAMAGIIINEARLTGRISSVEAELIKKQVEESIEIVFSSEMDRWCYKVSDEEEVKSPSYPVSKRFGISPLSIC